MEYSSLTGVRMEDLTFRQRLQKGVPGYEAGGWFRPQVRQDIFRAYELRQAANTLGDLLQEDRVASNCILREYFEKQQEVWGAESQVLLATPRFLLNHYENGLMDFVEYQCEHNLREVCVIPDNQKVHSFVVFQRKRVIAHLEGRKAVKGPEALAAIEFDIKLVEKLHVRWRQVPLKRTFEDFMDELREFKEKHGHVKVRRLEKGTTLGQWLHRMRAEYSLLENGKSQVPNLTPERIQALNDLGMVWRMRRPRPKPGDPRYKEPKLPPPPQKNAPRQHFHYKEGDGPRRRNWKYSSSPSSEEGE